jgi:hypothetical protein
MKKILLAVMFLMVSSSGYAATIGAEARGTVYISDDAAKTRVETLETQFDTMAIITPHPRVHLNAADVAGLQAKSGQASYQAVMTSADKSGVNSDQEMVDSAMAYLLTGTTQYAVDVYTYIMAKSYTAWQSPWNRGNTNLQNMEISAACMAFDYAYNGLNQTQRDNIVDKLGPLSFIDEFYFNWFEKDPVTVVRGETYHREEWIDNAHIPICEVALAHHYVHAEEVFKKRWSDLFYWGDAARLLTWNNEGTTFEGYYRGADGCSWMSILESATGIGTQMGWCENAWSPMMDQLDIENQRDIFNYGALNSKGRSRSWALTSLTGDPNPSPFKGYSVHTAAYAMENDPTAAWFLRHVGSGTIPAWRFSSHLSQDFTAAFNVADLIYNDETLPETDPTALGWYANFYPQNNLHTIGTGYASEDTRIFHRSMPLYTRNSHGSYEVDAWGVYKNGAYLTNYAGAYDAERGQSHLRWFAEMTWGKNSLIVYDLNHPETSYLAKGSYRDPGGVQYSLGGGAYAKSFTFQSPNKWGNFNANYTVLVHNPMADDWADMTGPQALTAPEQTDEYSYDVTEYEDAYGDRLTMGETHFMAIKESSDDDNAWIHIRKRWTPRDAQIRVIDLIYAATEPTVTGSGPYTITWEDYYGNSKITVYVNSAVDAITVRQGPVIGEIAAVDYQPICTGDPATWPAECRAHNYYPLVNFTKYEIGRKSGTHWQDSQLQYRVEIDPSVDYLDYQIYVYDDGESIPGTQPNVTWDAVNERLVLDGTIPTPDPTPSAPVLAAIGAKSVDEGSTLNFTATATDADGESLTFESSGLPSGATFVDQGDDTADFSWTPANGDAGVYNFTVTVRDPTGRIDYETVPITVNDVTTPEAPVWTQANNATVYVGIEYTLTVECTDDDTADVDLSASDLPTGAVFVDNEDKTGTLTWTPTSDQTSIYPTEYTITFEADDGTFQVEMAVTLTVEAIDNYPVLDLIGNREVAVNQQLSFTITGSDDGPTLAFTAANLPSGAIFDEPSATFSWTPISGQEGAHDITFSVEDSSDQTTSETVTVTVNPEAQTGSDPIVFPIDDFNVAESDVVEFTVVAHDEDNDIISVTTDLPANTDAIWDEETLYFSWGTNCDDAGTHTVTITATDSRGGTGAATVTINVSESCEDDTTRTIHFQGVIHLKNVNKK